MRHRHLNHENLTPAAIDDIIDRGRWSDWAELRVAALASPDVLRTIGGVCEPRIEEPYSQRHHFWRLYAQAHLATAARVQEIPPEAVVVGGTDPAVHVGRVSVDADQLLTDLRFHFDDVLAQLESAVLGTLDRIDTGVRQLIRTEPPEMTEIEHHGHRIRVPTEPEILRVRGALILKRNATRDYLAFVAVADHLGDERSAEALRSFDRYYPQASGQSALHQLLVQLATPLPFDLARTRLSEYKDLAERWHRWETVTERAARLARSLFDKLAPHRPP